MKKRGKKALKKASKRNNPKRRLPKTEIVNESKPWKIAIILLIIIAFLVVISFVLTGKDIISFILTGKFVHIEATVCDYNISSCGSSISVASKVYCLNKNISVGNGDCLSIGANNIVLDCKGFTINRTGSSGNKAGVDTNGKNNVTVKNCIIKDFDRSNDIGILIDSGANNSIINNNLLSNGLGIKADTTSGNVISGNFINASDDDGIYLTGSYRNNIASNTVYKSSMTFDSVEANIHLDDSNNNIIDSNTVLYSKNQGIRIYSSTGNNVTNNNVSLNTNEGLHLRSDSDNSSIRNNFFGSNALGIYLEDSDNNRFIGDALTKNGADFYTDDASTGNVITNMTFKSSLYSTTASFTYYGGFKINSSLGKPDTSGLINLSKYLDIIHFSHPTDWMLLNISYADASVPTGIENSLRLYKYNGTTWVPANTSSSMNGVDTVNKIVYANITSFSTFGIFGKDNAPPVITILKPANGSYFNYTTITLNASMADFSPKDMWYSVDGAANQIACTSCADFETALSLSEGKHNITVYGNDSSGNIGNSIVFFTIDTSAPALSSVSISPSIPSQSIYISKNITDLTGVANASAVIINASDGSVAGTVPLSLTNGMITSGTWTGTFNFSGFPDGTYTINDTITDFLGNSVTSTDGSVMLDRTSPILSIISIVSSYRKAGENVTVIASVNDTISGISNVKTNDWTASQEFNMTLISGSSSAGQESTWQVIFAAGLPEGLHSLTVTAYDNAIPPNTQAQNGTYTYDETPPVISNVPLASNITNIASLFVSGNVTDNIGLSTFTINGNSVSVYVDNHYATIVTLAEGLNTIVEIATDLAGNIANVNKTITLDSIPPAILFVDSTEQNNSFVSRNWIYVNVSVTEINEANITFSLYNGTMDLISSSFYTTPQREITWSGLLDGVYYYDVAVSDLAGNSGSSEKRKITLDSNSPIVSLISPIDRSGSNDGNLIFNYSVTDISDMANCSLILNNSVAQTNSGQEFSLIDLPVGPYNWSVICTDAASNNGMSLEWFFSSNRLTEFSGSTTDLSQVDVFNITSMTLETASGKIIFSDPVDFSNGIDIDSFGDISFNNIYLDGTALPELNKPALLYLYSLAFKDPAILEDGSPCSSCVKISYSGGVLAFNVNHFTTYSAKETAAERTRYHSACPDSYTDCDEWSECINGIQTRYCKGIDNLCDPFERTETKSCSIALPAPPLPIQLPSFPWLQIIIAFILLCLIALGWYLRRKYLLGLLKK